MGLNEEEKITIQVINPSSEWRFHQRYLCNKKDAQAIVHAHSPHAQLYLRMENQYHHFIT